MNKISTKIITCIILCTMITSILLCSISIIQSRHFLLSNAKEKVTLLAKTKSINFDREMSILENAVKNISFNVQISIRTKKIEGNDKYLAKFIKQIGSMVKNGASQIKGNVDAYVYLDPDLSKKNVAYQSVWVLNSDNTFKNAGELVPADKLDENDASMSWFFKPKKTKEGSWSSPYKDKFLKKELITYSTPIIQDGNFIGVVGMDIDFSIFKKIVNSVKIYKTGYAYLLNGDHNFLIHRKLNEKTNISKLQDKNGEDINKVMNNKKSGFSYVTYKGTKKLLGFSRLDNGFIFCVSAPESEILSDANKLTAILMGLILLGFAIAVAVGIGMAKVLVNPIYKVLNVMKLAEEGDLNCKAAVNSKDEIGKLANGFNNMVSGQKNIINKILTISNNTNETMNELRSSSEKVISSSSEVATSTQSIATSSNQQAEDASAISMNLEDFSDEINKIIIKTSDLENETGSIETMASSSKSQLKDMIDSIHSVYQFFNEVKTNIEALSQSIKEVSKITEVINGIAGQTNLLALNASIEAARSGEAGKGFAVVAQEIGNLAEQTGQSSGEINRLLNNLVGVVDEVVSKTETISIQFNNQEETVELSSNSFNQIITAVNAMSPKIKEINDSTKLIGDSKTEILSRIQSLAAAAQEISASTEEVASLTEEVDNVSKSISSQFGNLSEAFNQLNKEFERFKL